MSNPTQNLPTIPSQAPQPLPVFPSNQPPSSTGNPQVIYVQAAPQPGDVMDAFSTRAPEDAGSFSVGKHIDAIMASRSKRSLAAIVIVAILLLWFNPSLVRSEEDLGNQPSWFKVFFFSGIVGAAVYCYSGESIQRWFK